MQVFLSHTQSDRAFANDVRQQLQADGYEVWMSPASLNPGESVAEGISAGLRESDAFVVLLGKDSTESQWMALEIGGALASGKPVMPLLVERDARVPFLLSDTHYLDLTDPSARRGQLARLHLALEQGAHASDPASALDLIEQARDAFRKEAARYEAQARRADLQLRRMQLGSAAAAVIAAGAALLAAAGLSSSAAAILAGIASLLGVVVGMYLGPAHLLGRRGGDDDSGN